MVSVQSQTEPNDPATSGGIDEPRAATRADGSGSGLDRRQWMAVAALAAIIGAMAGAGVGAIVATELAAHNDTTIVQRALPPPARLSQVNDVPTILATVEPAVASITTDQGDGTGMVISAGGDIVTNYHVVAGANYIHVSLYHRSGYLGAFVTGYDQDSDVALLHVPGVSNLATVVLGDSSQVKVGDNVIAVGNALNLPGGPSATTGIVSALGRTIGGTTFTAGELVPPNLIQTDAAINPGNSGGALVDANGNLTGINTAIFSKSGGSQGIGFAIPVKLAMEVMKSIIEHGQVIRGWLGIEVQPLTQELAESFGLSGRPGIVVAGIFRDGPAQKAGLQLGDVILSIDGEPAGDGRKSMNQVARIKPTDKVTIQVMRNGKELKLTAEIGLRPPPAPVKEEE